jgi:hypothetical protein
MVDFSDALGLAALPGPAESAPPGTTASLGDLSTGGSIDVPLRPPETAMASPPTPARSSMASANSGIDLNQILGLLRQQQPSGFMPNFMASLGAGLSSAGQNWNKPAMAAFASGAGAAIQGGQALQQQQQKDRLALVNLALHAWQTGDMATYRKALINLRGARAAAPAAPPAAPPTSPGAATPPPEGTAPATSPPSPARATALSAAPPVALARTAPPDALAQARDAIARGAPREAVMARLREHGIDPIDV